MFWTCHCDVILRLGGGGVTWNSRNSTTRNQISAPINSHRNQHHPSSTTKKEEATENLHPHSSTEMKKKEEDCQAARSSSSLHALGA
jgi:hypothetical protein